MTKVGFVSLGCPKNLVDSEVMMGILAREGYELTPRADEAEILVVNTCSFIEAAQKESVDAILEMAEHKKFGAAKKLIVAGCLVERYRAQILGQVPEVDAVIGTGEVERIMEAVQGELRVLPAQPPAFLYHDLTPRIVTTPKHAAYIKIAEGCDHPCTFCIIPQLRGAFRSRRFESVMREAENLAKAGAREITLIGQDTTSYGEDLGLRDGLAQLLEKLAQTDDLLWVRFLYAYPNRVTQKLLDTIAAHPRLAKYMDMPLQHASRNVLARMKRGSNGDAFVKLLERIRTTIPGVSLRTSFIVGFPGETEADFEELCDFVRTANLDWMGVFEYSDVDNAGSYALDEKVDAETISDRRNHLMAIQKKISRENLRAKYLRAKQRASKDHTFTALIEGPSKDNPLVWEARLEGMAPEIDGKLYLTDIELPGGEVAEAGDIARVEITKTDAYDLVGRVAEILRRPAAGAGPGAVPMPPIAAAEKLHRIATGAPLRVLG
ncbi:MAG TPA: 30S ribosomal protein S12 methylthiotransferase RimO [Candidatus Limnocylindria bacterium]|jgi:ribosomal protein S12 methylthiotransferase|nr:30S ribosomal protein S12 methylthiotransferase RimO [Candidatus Limnocylindria bacterium]